MNVNDPKLRHEKECRLGNGQEVIVVGETFSHPIFPAGKPFFNWVRIMTKEAGVLGSAFFEDEMDESELKDKVDNVSEHIDSYLYPEFKKAIQN